MQFRIFSASHFIDITDHARTCQRSRLVNFMTSSLFISSPFQFFSGLITSLTPCRQCVRRLKWRVLIIFFSSFSSFALPSVFAAANVGVSYIFLECMQYRFTRSKQLLLTISINVCHNVRGTILFVMKYGLKGDEETYSISIKKKKLCTLTSVITVRVY